MKNHLLVLMVSLAAAPASAGLIGQVATPGAAAAGSAAAAAWSAGLSAHPNLMASLRVTPANLSVLAPVLGRGGVSLDVLSSPSAAETIRAVVAQQARTDLSNAAAAGSVGHRSTAFREALVPSAESVAAARLVLSREMASDFASKQTRLESLRGFVRGNAAMRQAQSILDELSAFAPGTPAVIQHQMGLPPLAAPGTVLAGPMRDPKLTESLQAELGLSPVEAAYAVVRHDGRSVYISGPITLGLESRELTTVGGRRVILKQVANVNPALLPYGISGWVPEKRSLIQISDDGGRTWTARPGDRTAPVLAPAVALPPAALPPAALPALNMRLTPAPQATGEGAVSPELAQRLGLTPDEAGRARMTANGGALFNTLYGSDSRVIELRDGQEVIVRTVLLDNGHMMPSIFRDESTDGGRTWKTIPQQQGPSTASGRGLGYKPGWKRHLQ